MPPQPNLTPLPQTQMPGGAEFSMPTSSKIEQPKPRFREDLKDVLEMTLAAAKVRVTEEAKTAGVFVEKLLESEVMKKMIADEEAVLAAKKSKDRAKVQNLGDEKVAETEVNLKEFERIYREEANAKTIVGMIDEMSAKGNLGKLSDQPTLEIPAELQKAEFGKSIELQKLLLSKLEDEVNALVKSTEKRELVMKGLRGTVGRISGAWDELSGTLETQDIYRALQFKARVRTLQEKKSARVSLGDHGYYHLDWDTAVGCKIAKDMGLSDFEQLKLDFAIDIHDIGYALPGVTAQTEGGYYGIEKDHRLQGSAALRDLWGEGYYKGLFQDAQSLISLQDMVLYHDQSNKINLKDEKDLNRMIRAAMIAADLSAVYQKDKLPGALVENPEVFLVALYKIKLAKENYAILDRETRPDLPVERFSLSDSIQFIKDQAKSNIKASERYDLEDINAINTTLDSLSVISPDFLLSRLTMDIDPKNFCGYNPTTGQIEFRFIPTGDNDGLFVKRLRALGGRGTDKQWAKLIEEFGYPSDHLDEASKLRSVIAAQGQVKISRNEYSKGKSSNTRFELEARKTITKMYQQNNLYVKINEVISSFLYPANSSEDLVTMLQGDKLGDYIYAGLKILTPSVFDCPGGSLTKDEAIKYLQDPKGKRLMKYALYDRRALAAKGFIFNKKYSSI